MNETLHWKGFNQLFPIPQAGSSSPSDQYQMGVVQALTKEKPWNIGVAIFCFIAEVSALNSEVVCGHELKNLVPHNFAGKLNVFEWVPFN